MIGFDPKTEKTVVLIILLQFPKQLVEFRPVGLCQGEFAVFSRQDMLVRRLAQSFNQSINQSHQERFRASSYIVKVIVLVPAVFAVARLRVFSRGPLLLDRRICGLFSGELVLG
jgi:hypothetical protein